MKFYLLWLSFVLSLTGAVAQQNAVEMKPAKPKIGETVHITFKESGHKAPKLVFSYSNLFEMPNAVPLINKNGVWGTSFIVPRYAKYASFYIQSDDKIIKPSDKEHFEIIFYNGDKPVMDTYLYKSYSLSAQMGKSDAIKPLGTALIEKELALYPDNYAAKLRLLANKMESDKPNASKYKSEALEVINAKLMENPTIMGNINSVTMGYLIIGENARIDSLKAMLLKKYPNSEVAFEYLYEDAYKTRDEEQGIAKMKKLVSYTTDGESSTLSGIHENLFAYYAKKKDKNAALESARIIAGIKNPWQPKEILSIATILAENDLALDTALMYANRALAQVSEYPFGVVRYFPEYGYIPGYVADKERLEKELKGDILGLIGNIYARQGNQRQSLNTIAEASRLGSGRTLLEHKAFVFEKAKIPTLALETYHSLLLLLPTDSVYLAGFKRNYVERNGSEEGYAEQYENMIAEWEKITLPKMVKNVINKPAPVFSAVYDMDGKLVDPETLKGKVIVLDFWATWCVPCIEGFPYMQQVYDKFKNSPDVVFMITNSGSKNSLKDAQEWVKRNNFTFPFYYNDRTLANAFDVTTIPSTFIIDRTGNIRYKTVGFEGPIMNPKLGLQIKDTLK